MIVCMRNTLVHHLGWMVEVVCDGVYCSGLLVAVCIGFLVVEMTSGKAIGGSFVFLPGVYQFSVVAPLTSLLAYTKGTVLFCMPKE